MSWWFEYHRLESWRINWNHLDEWIMFMLPHDHGATTGCRVRQRKTWIIQITRVQREEVFASKKLHRRDQITLEDVGFTEEDEIRFDHISKVSKSKLVTFQTFDIPSDGCESEE